MPKPKLIYFASRGRAEACRLVLAEAGVEYEEESFPGREGLDALKASGRLPFQAVPVWEEDGFTLAQSNAIALYLARQHGLGGKNVKEQALIDQAFGAVDDTRMEMRKLITSEPDKRPALRQELLTSTLPRWFGHFERLLARHGGGKTFFVGDALTVADLSIWYLLETAIDNGFGDALKEAPLLRAFFERVATRPRLAAYRQSPKRPPLQKFPS